MKRNRFTAALLCVMVLQSGAVYAKDESERRDRGLDWRGGSSQLHLDDRYHHNHYYPPRGYSTRVLPAGSISVGFGGGNYFFHGGVWFRPAANRFVVIAPPIGIVVPMLPPAYATLWIGGAPYYYANGVYYAIVPQGYAVVAPPAGADEVPPVPAPPTSDPLSEPH